MVLPDISLLLHFLVPDSTVTSEIDPFISIDYSLMEAPQATDQTLDVMFKVRVLNPGLGGHCVS